jgi:hypothetical protein
MGIYGHIYRPCTLNDTHLGVIVKVGVRFKYYFLVHICHINPIHTLWFFRRSLFENDRPSSSLIIWTKCKSLDILRHKPQRSDSPSETPHVCAIMVKWVVSYFHFLTKTTYGQVFSNEECGFSWVPCLQHVDMFGISK